LIFNSYYRPWRVPDEIEDIIKLWEAFKMYVLVIKNLQKTSCRKRKIPRLPNFPEIISEVIDKYAYFKKYGSLPVYPGKGDLIVKRLREIETIEVKCFQVANTPSSFGPTEVWDRLMFVDASKLVDQGIVVVYEVLLSNDDDDIKNIVLNQKKNTCFGDQCKNGRRPRISFNDMCKKIPPQYVKQVYNGHIKNLIPYLK